MAPRATNGVQITACPLRMSGRGDGPDVGGTAEHQRDQGKGTTAVV